MFKKILTPSRTSKGRVAGESQKGKYKPLSDSTENLGLPRENKASELRKENSKKTNGKESGSPIKQLGNSIKRETQKIRNNLRASIRTSKKKKVLQVKVEQKIPDDKEAAVPQKGMIRSIEGNLPAADSSSHLSRHSTLENLSTIDKQRGESKKQEVATLSEGTEATFNVQKVADSLSQSLMTEFPQTTQEQSLQEKPDSHGDSDGVVDLPATASEPLRHLTKARSKGPSERKAPSEEYRRKIRSKNDDVTEEFQQLTQVRTIIADDNNDSDSGVGLTGSKNPESPNDRSTSFSSSTESLNAILSAAEEDDTMQSDGEDKLNEERSPMLQVEQEPQIQPEPQEPVSANKETPIKKQSSDRNPNFTLAICCLAACCFIAAAFKGSGMLCLMGTALLITAVVIEWNVPSRELMSPNSSPFISGQAVAKT